MFLCRLIAYLIELPSRFMANWHLNGFWLLVNRASQITNQDASLNSITSNWFFAKLLRRNWLSQAGIAWLHNVKMCCDLSTTIEHANLSSSSVNFQYKFKSRLAKWVLLSFNKCAYGSERYLSTSIVYAILASSSVNFQYQFKDKNLLLDCKYEVSYRKQPIYMYETDLTVCCEKL